MAKRFTDSHKWRDEWFRTLPLKAKLAWSYLCDECDHAGVWKSDFGLASFQLDFKVVADDLRTWFGDRVHFFDKDKILIVPFFEFQYGESKDSWNAKAAARGRLETLGFLIVDNRVQIQSSPDSPPTVPPTSATFLNTGIDTDIGKVNSYEGGLGETKPKLPELALLWNDLCGELSKVERIGPERQRQIKARLRDIPDMGRWADVIRRIAASDWCNGRSPGGTWRADFDFLLKPGTEIKAMEGKYDNRGPAINSDPFALLRGLEGA